MTVKKGDAVVLEQIHSSFDIKMKRTTWSTFHVAQATKVEKGLVKACILPSGEKPAILGSYRILTILEEQHQEGARRLYRKIKPSENDFPDRESIKKAISEAFAFDRVL
jgi:HEPN domain-containing protein